MSYIRKKHLQQALSARKTHRIILIGGLAGTGKKTLLSAIITELKQEKPPVRIVQIREEKSVDSSTVLQQARALGVGPSVLIIENAENEIAEALSKIISKYSVTVFLIAQNERPMETTLNRLVGDLAYTIRLPPLSYPEFLEANTLRDSMESLELYAQNGGLIHHAILPPDSPDRCMYLEFRANSFLLTEVIERFTVRNPRSIRELLYFVARHTGESLSSRQIQEAFSHRRMTISPQAALDYLAYCGESGILVPVTIYDLSRKKDLESGTSWYFGDTGLRCAFVNRDRSASFDRALANLVYLSLIDGGWHLKQGRIIYGNGTREDISFVCEKDDKRLYVQMEGSAATAEEHLRKRTALLAIRDAWPKYLVGAYSEKGENDGIIRRSVRELLLNSPE
ncbi:MAG TPA: ATP-binding protein [Treponema sp.]|nr:ATP-binding protein [Treponema sp.]